MSLATAVVGAILNAVRVVVLELAPGSRELLPERPQVALVAAVRSGVRVLAAPASRLDRRTAPVRAAHAAGVPGVRRPAGGDDRGRARAAALDARHALEAATDEGQRRDLGELSKAASRGADLVSQLLAFSRRRPVDAVALDITEVVRDVEPMLRRTIGEHIELRCWLASELPPTVIDPGQLTQVLLNLAVNARDAMPDGGRLTIRATQVGGGVQLMVEDTGHGMSEETLAKALDPFFTTKGPGSGTGLGLATVYGIVEQAKGTIALESDPAWGTRVTIELPCHTVARGPALPASV